MTYGAMPIRFHSAALNTVYRPPLNRDDCSDVFGYDLGRPTGRMWSSIQRRERNSTILQRIAGYGCRRRV
jgi:hypothetical protein